MTITTVSRTRTRGLPKTQAPEPVQPVATPVVEEQAVVDEADLKAKLAAFWRANVEANAKSRIAERAQKELATAMALANIKRVAENVALENGAVVPVVAEVLAEPKEVISVERLRKLVDDETFMKIVAATKTAVDAHAGTNVRIQSTVTTLGKESLKIRKVAP